ncbi:DMT family transporter [Paenibacillus planticolens]|uniref:EamA-like transporter family protein n=1 Tax=Paenibacillus planticolens TaxID=2654976 RepID=A0ABX1ZY01_9BACL|nr:DMT family transporter [Paenibacillus planticolens]NOV04832.1 EamA-like transporter family protein [Paenibacillus planticolens]
MIWGILMALAAGSLISVQNMFNSKVNVAARSHSTTALVLGMGFLASLSMGLIFDGVGFFTMKPMQPWFWFSGLLGIGVVTCVVNGVRLLGPSYAISIVMASQLLCALWWDSAGWFGLDKVPFTFQKAIGVAVLICGLILFKAKPRALVKDNEAVIKNATISE